MKKPLQRLISGLTLLSISIALFVPASFAGETLMEGDRAPYGGFLFKREELDQFQLMKEEMKLLDRKYAEKLAEYTKPRSPAKAALFSLLIPGTGQLFYSDDWGKGKIMLGSEIFLLAGALFFSYQADSQLTSYSSSGNASDFNDATDSKNTRDLFFYGMVGLGIYSAIDAWLGVKQFNKIADENTSLSYSIKPERNLLTLNYNLKF